MKRNQILHLILLPLLCVCMSSCDSDTPIFGPGNELPPETTTGANTFGCLVNSKVWTNGGIPFPYASLGIVEMSDSTLSIYAKRQVPDTLTTIGIHLRIPSINEGSYFCDSIHVNIRYTINIGDPVLGFACTYSHANECKVEITRYDLETRIVSGRFEALLSKTNCEDIIITEGRFDVRY